MKYEVELNVALKAAKEAREVILKYYHDGFHIEIKEDNSPVTEADKNADKIIRKVIHESFPTHEFLTEEAEDNKKRLSAEFVWIVDPVDGTKDFINKDDEFTTNIALCKDHEIVVGVVAIPARNIYYYAVKGEGAFKLDENGQVSKIHVNNKTSNLTCLRSVFHFNENEQKLIEKHSDKIKTIKKAGSSLKACLISEGKAEISYRISGGTKEWDTAAFQIIVEEAGGLVLKPNKERMLYNREDVYNREGYLIINNIENFLI